MKNTFTVYREEDIYISLKVSCIKQTFQKRQTFKRTNGKRSPLVLKLGS